MEDNDTQAGLHWKRWEIMKMRKDRGGMGFRDLVTVNKTLLGKQAWRMVKNPNTLWGKLMKGLYFNRSEFWHADSGCNPSWGWKSLLIGREAITDSIRWSIENGESVNIRTDKWLRRGLIGGPANRNDPKQVSELILPGTQMWNEPLVRNLFDTQTTQEILAIPIDCPFFTDELVWTGTQHGSFTVKNGYNLLRDNITENTAN